MPTNEEEILTHAHEANRNAERAYWWLKNIDHDVAQHLGLADKVWKALNHLQEVENITLDIQIAIRQNN